MDTKETIETTINCSFGVDVVADRIDAYVCGLLYFAMKGGYDIVSELPISDQLYYNLNIILLMRLFLLITSCIVYV